MHTAAGHPRAPRALLFALLLAIAALGLLPHSAAAQDECPVLQPNCVTSTTEDVTSTTVDGTTTTDPDEETSTTERTATTQREEVTTTTLTVTTLHNVLIPGDGTAGSESTTTTAAPTATASSGLSDSALIAIVASALGLVALVAGILTWRYWSATRPRVVEAPPERAAPRAARSAFLD